MEEKRKEDATRRILVFLLLIIILVSIVGTYGLVKNIKDIRASQVQNVEVKPYGPDKPVGTGLVSIEILSTPKEQKEEKK